MKNDFSKVPTVDEQKKFNEKINNPFYRQVGGDHYTNMTIQPMEYSMANELNAMQHTAIKYISRYKAKSGIEDLKKAIHVIEMLIKWENDKKPVHKGRD